MWTRFATLANFGIGIGAVIYAWLLLRRKDRLPLHARVAAFLLCTGAGLVAQGIYVRGHSCLALIVMWLAFSSFPLPLALSMETLLKRPLPLPFKLFVLVGVLASVVSGPLLPRALWHGLIVGFHIGVIAWLGGLALARSRRVESGPVRRFFASTALLCATAVVFLGADWAQDVSYEAPRLGGIALGLVLYLGASNLHAGADWRLRTALTRMLGGLAFAVLAALVVVQLDSRGADAQEFGLIVATLAALGLIVEPIRLSSARSNAESYELVIERLGQVPVDSEAAFTRALRTWPELRRLEHLPPRRLAEEGYDRLADYLQCSPNVVSVHQVRLQTLLGSPAAEERPLEQLAHLMKAWDLDHVAWLGAQRGLLGVSFNVGVEERTYVRFFAVIASIFRLVPASKGEL
jgi:hypothetical protein